MRKELKICLPVYKVLYSVIFVLLLAIIRGITYTSQIGIAMEAPMALLTLIFCADTYLMEDACNRRDVFRLYPLKKQTRVLYRRLLIQMIYMVGISAVGYGIFYGQKPIAELNGISSAAAFGLFLPAITGTVFFWGILSMTISNIYRNIWAGIGSVLFVWFVFISPAGERFFGKWSVFSFTFRNINNIGDWDWICGKLLSVLLAGIMAALIPFLLKKRG